MLKTVTIILLLISFKSFACGCPPPVFENEVAKAEAIYIGTVQSASIDKAGIVRGSLQVNKLLKGKLKESIAKVQTDVSDCGVPLTIGQTYVIFKSEESDIIEACGFTHEINRLFEEEYSKLVLEAVKSESKKKL